MNILITGAFGFIGTYLSKYLSQFHSVYRISSKKKDQLSGNNTIHIDLTDADFEMFLPEPIDCVIHLAQSSKYREFPQSSVDILQVNVDATFRLLEWSRNKQIKHFIFTSTANVYSQSSELLDENSPTVPSSFYGATKLAAELLARQYQEYFHVDILRLFTVYGPGQKNMLFPSIIDRVKTGQEISLAGGAGIYLTPIYVNDVVTILNKLISSARPQCSRLLNICGDRVVTLSDIVSCLERLLEVRAHLRLTDEAPRFFVGSNKRLRSMLKGLELTQFEDGLLSTAMLDNELN